MFSFHWKYFVYRELKRTPQKLSFCFKCPDIGTVRILGNILYQESNFSSPRSAKQLGESFSTYEMTFRRKLKKTSVHYVNLKQAKEKLDTELLFLN